jgi:hypothetical protein
MYDPLIITKFQKELDMAEAARAAGNEGRARVCARRAAGIVIGEFFNQRGISSKPGTYERLRTLSTLPEAPVDVIQVVDHFLLRVNPDQQLPIPVDLVEEARWLKSRLLDGYA